MARTRRTEKSNSLVASAARVSTGSSVRNLSRIGRTEAWQREAWTYYRTIGEFRYACDWVGSMLSKAILFATRETPEGYEKIKDGPAYEHVDSLFGDSDGKAEMLRLIGIHMTVIGECYIVAYPDSERNNEVDKWEVVASTGLRRNGTSDDSYWIINDELLDVPPNDVLVVKVWRPDPEKPSESISPARAVLAILGEIARLTDHVAAQVDSRLAGAGLLLMPSEMTFPPAPDPDTNTEGPKQQVKQANDAESLMAIIQEAMAKSIDNRSDPSALVPIVITAPQEAIEKVRHVTFWSELDEHAIELRNEAIRRLGLGMDMPPEVLQGVSDTNHWSAWQSDESAIKNHTEPLLKIITSALADGFLRPLLDGETALDDEVIAHYSIKADTSEMRVRPNRSKEALELYDRGALSGAALLRETGFDATDEMSEGERKTWLLRKMASGSTTPEQVEAAFKILYETELTPGTTADGQEPREERPAPSLEEHPTRDIPDQERSERRKIARERGEVPSAASLRESSVEPALVAASEQVVIRALERAGNKLKNKMQVKPSCAASEIYKFVHADDQTFLLDDAWQNVPAIAERHQLSAEWLQGRLDSYCRILLSEQTAHTYDRFDRFLTTRKVTA